MYSEVDRGERERKVQFCRCLTFLRNGGWGLIIGYSPYGPSCV